MAGGTRYGPPSLQVRFADGSRAFEWQPVGHRVHRPSPGVHDLELAFRDRRHPLQTVLHYQVREDSNVIERRLVVRNDGDTPVQLLRVESAAWSLPPLRGYRLSQPLADAL